MGPAWVWFTVALVAAVLGGLLLYLDQTRRTAHSRDRRRWAELRGWRFVEAEPDLASRWRYGEISEGGPGDAKNLVVGRLFTPAGRRHVEVFDHEQAGKVTSVVVAVQRGGPLPFVAELWLPNVPFPQDAGLDLLGPVADRYAFVTDLDGARALFTQELIDVCGDIGEDVRVAWFEADWILGAAPVNATPARLERLLRALGEIADHLDAVEDGADGTSGGVDPEEPNEITNPDTSNPDTGTTSEEALPEETTETTSEQSNETQ